MEIIIILFVIYGIVSSISKKRAEERKRQEQQTKARLQNAYPPDVWPRRDPPEMQYEQPDVPQQVYNEPPRHVMPFGVPPSPYYVQEPTPDQMQAHYEPSAAQAQKETAPSQALYEKFFNAVDKWMGEHAPFGQEAVPETRSEGEKTFEPVQTVADKLMNENATGAAKVVPPPSIVRHAGAEGFALGMSRRDIINGVIWSEILTRPQERIRRRVF